MKITHLTKKRTKPKTYEVDVGSKKVRVTVPESDGHIDRSAARAAPAKDGQTAAEMYAERRRDIDRLLGFLGQELRKHETQAKADARNFGYAGDLYRLRSCLVEAVAGFRGVDIEDVELHLDGQADDLVLEADACPKCGERSTDSLVWQEEGETVHCTNCGTRYTPPSK
jgi:hypothetical protein